MRHPFGPVARFAAALPQVGSQWRTTYLPISNTTTIERLAPGGAPQVIEPASDGRSCRAWDAAGGALLLTCAWPNLVMPGDGSDVSQGAVWTAAKGLKVVTVGSDEPTLAWTLVAQSGWAVLYGSAGHTAVPLSALTPP